MPAFAAAPVARRHGIVRRYLKAGATSPETAKTPEEAGSFKGLGLMYARLEARGVLKSCGENRYYVDAAAAARDARRIRSNALMMLGVIIAIALVVTSATAAIPLWGLIVGIVIAVLLVVSGIFLSGHK